MSFYSYYTNLLADWYTQSMANHRDNLLLLQNKLCFIFLPYNEEMSWNSLYRFPKVWCNTYNSPDIIIYFYYLIIPICFFYFYIIYDV